MDIAVATVKAQVATNRVAAVVDKELAFQPGRLIVDQFQGPERRRFVATKGFGAGGPLVVVLGNDCQRIGFRTGHHAADHAVRKPDVLFTPGEVRVV